MARIKEGKQAPSGPKPLPMPKIPKMPKMPKEHKICKEDKPPRRIKRSTYADRSGKALSEISDDDSSETESLKALASTKSSGDDSKHSPRCPLPS